MNDGKYGSKHGRLSQKLCSYKVVFDFKAEGALSYLSGRIFEIKNCDIIKKFEEIRLEK